MSSHRLYSDGAHDTRHKHAQPGRSNPPLAFEMQHFCYACHRRKFGRDTTGENRNETRCHFPRAKCHRFLSSCLRSPQTPLLPIETRTILKTTASILGVGRVKVACNFAILLLAEKIAIPGLAHWQGQSCTEKITLSCCAESQKRREQSRKGPP